MQNTNQTSLREIDQSKLKYLILSVLNKCNKTIPQGELVKLIANELRLTKEELDDHYERKSDKVFYKMVATNEQRLQAAGLEIFVNKAGHLITEEGKKAITDNKQSGTITYAYLRTINKYKEWEKALNIAPKEIENDKSFVVPNYTGISEEIKIPSTFKYNEVLLLNEIKRIRDNFKELEWYYRASEENVRSEIIEPILRALGWSAPYLRREERCMDYLLCAKKSVNIKTPKIVIEAKRYCEQLKTNGASSNNENEIQLQNYCGKEMALAGVLTNGIKWCLFSGQGYEYKGEIDILSKQITNEELCAFFKSFSTDTFIQINQLDWDWLSKYIKDENHPSKIIIDGNHQDSKDQSEVFYDLCVDFIKKCNELGSAPTDFKFFKKIILDKHSSKETQMRQYGKYYINTKSGVYEKIALLQELNATFDLGHIISTE